MQLPSVLAFVFLAAQAFGQSLPSAPAPQPVPDPPGRVSKPTPSDPVQSGENSGGQQTKRILGIAPNFQAVSANAYPPPLAVKQKFWLATQGSFDYSSFISVGLQAAIEQAFNTYPEFHQGAAGYGRYYWHTFADAGIENYMTGAIIPALTHEDPRYYTLYHGGFFHRASYAFSRLWITRKDNGSPTGNFSEIIGSGAAAGLSSRYYPHHEREPGEIFERWGGQVLNDGVGNVFQEFWPDIREKLLHRH